MRRSSQECENPFCKVKRVRFIRRVMNAVSVKVRCSFVLFFPRSPFYILLVFVPPVLLIGLSIHSLVSPALPFSLIYFLCLPHRIYCGSLYLPALTPPPKCLSSVPCCLPVHSGSAELKATRWPSQRLQHRTWVLAPLTTRVLCCSQWSCLSDSQPV